MAQFQSGAKRLTEAPAARTRLETLVRLRWLAVAGQTAAILVIAFGFRFPLPLWPCLALIAASAILNGILLVRCPLTMRLPAPMAATQLAYDSVQLAGLLYLTGGLTNPFSLLLLAPVSVSATTLPRRWTLAVSALVIVLAGVLAVFHWPLPWDPARELVIDPLYVAGIGTALILGVVFVAAYTNRVAHEARQLAAALTATELVLAREQHLNALDGLAAAAAHELGTPLATIALAAREMQAAGDDPGSIRQDIALIGEQADRCREILGKLRNLDARDGGPFTVMTLPDMVAETVEPHRPFGTEIVLQSGPRSGPEPRLRRNAGIMYGLGNLIENAVDYAREKVTVTTGWNAETVWIEIVDDGPGFTPDLVARIGEPYLTTRPRRSGDSDPSEPGGLGLGIFIAKTLLERAGARLTFANAGAEGHARVTVHWPASVWTAPDEADIA